jgi:hypothetical protein
VIVPASALSEVLALGSLGLHVVSQSFVHVQSCVELSQSSHTGRTFWLTVHAPSLRRVIPQSLSVDAVV